MVPQFLSCPTCTLVTVLTAVLVSDCCTLGNLILSWRVLCHLGLTKMKKRKESPTSGWLSSKMCRCCQKWCKSMMNPSSNICLTSKWYSWNLILWWVLVTLYTGMLLYTPLPAWRHYTVVIWQNSVTDGSEIKSFGMWHSVRHLIWTHLTLQHAVFINLHVTSYMKIEDINSDKGVHCGHRGDGIM